MSTCVTFAGDGLEAVAAFTSRPVGYYDLVFMDLHMPNVCFFLLFFLFSLLMLCTKMDGMQATAEIKKWEKSQYEAMV